MLTVNKLISQARGLAPSLLKRAPTVTLDWDTRQKSRFDTEDSQGRTLGIFLPRGSVVRGGDVLVAEDGSLIRVGATPQPVLVVRICAEHGAPVDLLRAAYHLGNRHVQLEVRPDRLQLERDHVLAEMLRSMHLIVTEEVAAFEPEGGAYSSGGHAPHGHDHAHDNEHKHEHEHEHEHERDPGPVHAATSAARSTIPIQSSVKPHVHGPDCQHEHDDPHHHGHKH